MSETTRILWSGLTGRTGRKAISIAAEMTDVDIVAGISRTEFAYVDAVMKVLSNKTETMRASTRFAMQGLKWYQYAALSGPLNGQPKDFDVIVDFSNAEVFNEVVSFAVRTGKPLISGTSELTGRQMAMLYDATQCIPVFRSGNFRFKVKKFIDEAVELSQRYISHSDVETNGPLWLFESQFNDFQDPNPMTQELIMAVYQKTGMVIEENINRHLDKDWILSEWHLGEPGNGKPILNCSVSGFDGLAHDVLEIAKVMKAKPLKKGEFYNLDEIWDDIPEAVKNTI